MTELLSDIIAMNEALDANPEDQHLRSVLADAYEDVGDQLVADGLRLLVKYEKYPVNICWRYSRNSTWLWQGSRADKFINLPAPDDHDYIPSYQEQMGISDRLRCELYGAAFLGNDDQWSNLIALVDMLGRDK